MKKKLFISAIISIIASAILVYCYYFETTDSRVYGLIIIISVLIALLGLSILWSLAFHKENPIKELFENAKDKVHIFIAITQIVMIFTFLTSPIAIRIFDYHKLELETTGSTVGYYVIAEDENNNEYTLPAKVIISSDEQKEYIVEKVFFKNNGYLYFRDPEILDGPNDICRVTDQRGKRWNITLTNNYVENFEYEYIADISTITYIEYAFLLLGTLAVLISSYRLIFIKEDEKHEKD